jgi:hypothetical protein
MNILLTMESGHSWLVTADDPDEAIERWNEISDGRERAIMAWRATREDAAHCRSIGQSGW